MNYDPVTLLAKDGRRAKSDVANKLIAMALHQLSRLVSDKYVRDPAYLDAVREAFRDGCPYCSRRLEPGKTVREHLDAMNQFRAGLHVRGNVLVACSSCNQAKRSDDQADVPPLGTSGWSSFLGHDGTRCPAGCRTCGYWRYVWSDDSERQSRLRANLARIEDFRETHLPPVARSITLQAPRLKDVYARCQKLAQELAAEAIAGYQPD